MEFIDLPHSFLTPKAFAQLGAPDLVYVRAVAASDVMAEASDEAGLDAAVHLEPGQTFYAVHSADGERLALMTDRESAFAAAVAHELAPVSVH